MLKMATMGHDIRCPAAIAEATFLVPETHLKTAHELQWLPTELMLPALVWFWLISGPLNHVSYKYATIWNYAIRIDSILADSLPVIWHFHL